MTHGSRPRVLLSGVRPPLFHPGVSGYVKVDPRGTPSLYREYTETQSPGQPRHIKSPELGVDCLGLPRDTHDSRTKSLSFRPGFLNRGGVLRKLIHSTRRSRVGKCFLRRTQGPSIRPHCFVVVKPSTPVVFNSTTGTSSGLSRDRGVRTRDPPQKWTRRGPDVYLRCQ